MPNARDSSTHQRPDKERWLAPGSRKKQYNSLWLLHFYFCHVAPRYRTLIVHRPLTEDNASPMPRIPVPAFFTFGEDECRAWPVTKGLAPSRDPARPTPTWPEISSAERCSPAF